MNQKLARLMVKLNRPMWWLMLLTIPLDIFAAFFYASAATHVHQFRTMAFYSLVWAGVKLTYCWLNRAGK